VHGVFRDLIFFTIAYIAAVVGFAQAFMLCGASFLEALLLSADAISTLGRVDFPPGFPLIGKFLSAVEAIFGVLSPAFAFALIFWRHKSPRR